jgi:hypothetical protein
MLPFVLKCARGWLFAQGFEPTTCVTSWCARLNPFARFSNVQPLLHPAHSRMGHMTKCRGGWGLEAP